MTVLSDTQLETYKENGFLIIDSEIEEYKLDAIISFLEPVGESQQLPGAAQVTKNHIQDAWRANKEILSLSQHPKILSTLEDLYNRKPLPFQTLNFPIGTQQPVHSDSIHFNSEPFGMMCGVWVALEDIGPDQGPLIYYPGSHKLP